MSFRPLHPIFHLKDPPLKPLSHTALNPINEEVIRNIMINLFVDPKGFHVESINKRKIK